MVVCGTQFINEGLTGGFEGVGEQTGGKDEGDEVLKLLEPDRMEAGEKVEGETAKSSFQGNMFDGVMEGWDCCSKVGWRW